MISYISRCCCCSAFTFCGDDECFGQYPIVYLLLGFLTKLKGGLQLSNTAFKTLFGTIAQ